MMNRRLADLRVSVRCAATTGLTAVEAAKLRVACREVPPVGALLSCEIAVGHDDSHVAFATTANDGELWWWLHWGAQTRDVRQIDPCEVRSPDEPYLDDCLLPGGHPGPHSFDLHDGY
jgi:hypothetical protein